MAPATRLGSLRRRGLWAALGLAACLGSLRPVQAAELHVFTVVGWLNQLCATSSLAVLGQVLGPAQVGPRGETTTELEVGQVYQGPRLGRKLNLVLRPERVEGRFLFPQAPQKGQWVLAFCRSEGGRWSAPPWGRIVETPFEGLSFFTGPEVVLSDAAPGLSWSYVLEALEQVVATRRRITNVYLPTLRAASTQEQRDRTRFAIEWQVKESLGLPVP